MHKLLRSPPQRVLAVGTALVMQGPGLSSTCNGRKRPQTTTPVVTYTTCSGDNAPVAQLLTRTDPVTRVPSQVGGH